MNKRLWQALALALVSAGAQAAVTPNQGPADPRIRLVTYNPYEVVVIDGYYGFAQVIAFSDDETITNIAIGDSLAWQVTPNAAGDRVFLKPIAENAHTNMTVVTNERAYHFELFSRGDSSPRGITYAVHFRYPKEAQAELRQQIAARERVRAQEVVPGHSVPPSAWNLDYSYRGRPGLAPLHVFDDGTFTYFQFRQGQEIPAIFLVRATGDESLINFHVKGEYVVVERIARQFTLRSGAGVVCVFNDDLTKEAESAWATRPLQHTTAAPTLGAGR